MSAGAAPRLDRHGDPLPDGALARLGTIRQRVRATLLAVSPDGRTFITVTDELFIGRWDADSGRLRDEQRLRGRPTPNSPPSDYEQFRILPKSWLSDDGQLLAIAEKEEVVVYDTATGVRKHRLAVSADRVALSPDRRTLITTESGKSPCRIRLWDLATGKDRLLAATPIYANDFAFRPDGKRLFAAVGNRLLCWDLASGKQVWGNDHGAGNLAVSPDGRTVCSDGEMLHLWDADTGRRIGGGSLGKRSWKGPLVFARDGRTVFLSDSTGMVLWDVATGKVRRHLPGVGSPFAVAPDGKTVVSLSGGLLHRWDVESGKSLDPDTREHGHTNTVRAMVFTPDDRTVATAGDDGTIRVWDLASQRPRILLTDLPGHTSKIHAVILTDWDVASRRPILDVASDSRRLLSEASDGTLRVIDILSGWKLRRFDVRGEAPHNDVDTARLSVDGRTLWAFTVPSPRYGSTIGLERKETLIGWNVATGRHLSARSLTCGARQGNVISPDGQSVALAYNNVYDVASGRPRLNPPRGHLVNPFAFSADSRLFAAASLSAKKQWDAIGVHELLTGRPLVELTAPVNWSSSCAFSPDGRLLIAAGRDALYVWEVSTGRRLLHLAAAGRLPAWSIDSFGRCLAVAPDGRSAATGHEDGTVLIWDLAPAWRKLTPPAAAPTPAQLDACWSDLLKDDPRTAYSAVDRLSAAPAQALPLLRKHLRPVTIDSQWLERRLADLDSSDFAAREKASRELEKVAESVEPRLRRAMPKGVSLELRRRLQAILEVPIPLVPPAETVRQLRAVAVLERIATPEARSLLRELGRGESVARLTIAARAALARLAAKSQR